jgi:hypothetical protein
MDIQTYAKRELDLLLKNNPDTIIKPFIPEILSFFKKVKDPDQSGGSPLRIATEISRIVEKLCYFEPLTPLTGNDDEWIEKADEPGCYQNNRNLAVFKKNGKAYYSRAIIWASPVTGFFDTVEGISSTQVIKSFPFTPKTFVIDVDVIIINSKTSSEGWKIKIKDREQLRAVAEYYDLQLPW